MRRIMSIAGLVFGVLFVLSGCVTVDPSAVEFVLRIENVSQNSALVTPISPVVLVVHDPQFNIFEENTSARETIERLVEDGYPVLLAEELAGNILTVHTKVINVPVEQEVPSVLLPRESYETTFFAPPGKFISFLSMIVESNDLFIAPDDDGIALFENGMPISGNITDMVSVWDGGTEINEPLGVGEFQAPRQSAPNSGIDEFGTIVKLEDFEHPLSQLVRITIENHHKE